MQPRAAFPQLMISGLRLFSKRHSTASMALAPAFDRRHPDCPNRFPTMCLQALPRRRIRPAIRVRGRGRSAFGACWPHSGGRRSRRLPPELRPADGAVRPIREDAEEGTSAAPEFRCSRARSASRREPTPCPPPDAASKTCAGPTSSIGGPVMPPPPNPRNGMHPGHDVTRLHRSTGVETLCAVNKSAKSSTVNSSRLATRRIET